MAYDVQGALDAGVTPDQITAYLAANPASAMFNVPSRGPDPVHYDVAGALGAGIPSSIILAHVNPAGRTSMASMSPAGGDSTAAPIGTPTDATASAPAMQQPSAGATQAAPTAASPPLSPPGHVGFQVGEALGAGFTPQQITDYWVKNPKSVPFRTQDAIDAGYSSSEIIDHLNKAQQSPGDRLIGIPDGSLQGIPILAPIQRGVAAAQAGVANLADDIGWHGEASRIRSRINQVAANAQTAGGNLVNDLKAGHYGAALEDAPSAALEQSIPTAAALAGTALTGGAAAGAIAAGAGIGALSQGDQIARARAANNGHSAPDATDLALGLGGGAGLGALGSIGLGGVATKVAGAAGLEGLRATLASTAAHATGDALQPQAGALAGSVGTQAGAQMAPFSDSAAAALTGATARGGLAVPGGVVNNLPGVKSAALSQQFNQMAPADQAHLANVVGAHRALLDAASSGVGTASEPSVRAAAATASDTIAANVKQMVGTLKAQGLLGDDDSGVITAAMKAARSPNTVLTQDHLDAIDALGLPADDTTSLRNAALQTTLLSNPESLRAAVGPAQGIMQALGGHTGGAIAGGLIGGHMGAEMGYLAGNALRPVLKGAFGKVGAMADQAVGLGKSPLQAAADNGRVSRCGRRASSRRGRRPSSGRCQNTRCDRGAAGAIRATDSTRDAGRDEPCGGARGACWKSWGGAWPARSSGGCSGPCECSTGATGVLRHPSGLYVRS